MNSYIIFGSMDCVYCRRAKTILEAHRKRFTFVDIYTKTGRDLLNNYKALNIIDKDFKTMPMIVKVKSTFLGGFDDLSKHLNKKSKIKTKKQIRKKIKRKRKKGKLSKWKKSSSKK